MRQLFGLNGTNKDIFVFVIGLFSMIKFRLLGTFGVSELLVFASYVFISPLLMQENKQVRRLVLFAFVWLLGVVFSDLVNYSSLENSLKGAFNVIFIIALIPFVYWALYDKPERMLYFWAGVAISSILGFRFQRLEMMNELAADTWFVYAVKWLFLFLGGWLYYKGRIKVAYILIVTFAVWTLFHQSRNIFLMFVLSISILMYIGEVTEYNILDKYMRYRKGAVKLFIILAITFIGISYTYETFAANGTLGEYAKAKYEKQKYSELGLASGRADFLASLYAISKKPIFGYGSYAKDENMVFADFNRKMGLPYKDLRSGQNHVPAHSYMLGAWVNAGILGFIFWLFVLRRILIFLRYHLFNEPKLLCINLLLTFSLLWNIFFSPFSDRLNFVFYILSVILISEEDKQYEVNYT
jgi:hypothetical protein